ncbi:MAG: S8 family serine peptidase [Planctomycetes bacterium]|nr:S8 family serine peptidase [Planctomycetota bacterium]
MSLLVVFGLTAGATAGSESDLFVETPGVAEFSGRMIARPIQTPAARAGAEALLSNDDLIAYRWRTDEYIFAVPTGSTENETAARLMAQGIFEYVQPDWRVFALECSDDPLLGSQWHHTMMDSCRAWDIHNAMLSPVTVAVVDTGIRPTHEDLRNFQVEGYDAFHKIWESEGGDIVDANGHGTLTTGAAAAEGNNGVGVSGMGWQLQHRMVKAVEGGNGWAWLSDLTHGAIVAVENGDFVASVSFSLGWDRSIETAGRVIMEDYGGLLVWAAGNDGARHDEVDHEHAIIVGATSRGGIRASFSNYGKFIDVFAPGVDVLTTTLESDSSYGAAGGTSLATPLVAGLCAMIKSARPNFDNWMVLKYLEAGCRDMGDEALYGAGEISLYGSLSLLERMELEILDPPLNSGQDETFVAYYGEPHVNSALFYSTVGEGETIIPGYGIVLGLHEAQQAGTVKLTTIEGTVFWTLRMPKASRTRLLWFQAVDETGQLSQVLVTQLNP